MPSSVVQSIVLALVLFPFCTITAAEVDTTDLVRMPITYQDAMLVVVTKEGAAAVRFIDAFEKGNEFKNGIVGTFYEWRFLERKPDAVEQTGKGRVFAKLADGIVQHGSFDVNCGPLQFSWSHVDEKTGIIKYDPTKAATHPVALNYFGERVGPDGKTISKPADLSRFLYVDEESNKVHRDEVYDGPDSKTGWYTGQVAGPIQYGNCIVVARDPHGVATFQFGNTFERHPNENEKHVGVPYEFTFRSHDGKINKTGKGEVYERYRENKYDNGRLNVEAGPLHFVWSVGGKDRGWAYYDQAWIRIWYADQKDAKQLIDAVTTTDLIPAMSEN